MRPPAAWRTGVLLCALAFCACTGPRPEVLARRLEAPRSPGAPWLLAVTIRNAGGGEGEIEAVARLISTATGATAGQCTRTLDLGRHETATVVFRFEGVPAGDYRASVAAVYPP